MLTFLRPSFNVALVALFIACSVHTEEPAHYPAANLENDTYQAGEGWELAWSDDFTGLALNADNWNLQQEPPGRFNDEWQRYTDSTENAYVEDGCLVIRALHTGDEHGMGQYTSARLNTANKQSWTYGKIAARIQLPHGEGMWPAFWMLGANINENGGDTPWPQSGEIDIMEFYGSRSGGTVEANIHYANEQGQHTQMGAQKFELPEGRFADAFHVFEIEWNEERIEWLVDGQPYASSPITGAEFSEFHKPFFILLNIAVGGQGSGRPDETTPFPSYMYVDWVRVYQDNKTSISLTDRKNLP
ncbi:MAG: glycoside hydrolase family 16 protein [Xanthomonadales bacterium]|nr:glycoside hydrolase family 16 protein [Xanthomonadales bacterium]